MSRSPDDRSDLTRQLNRWAEEGGAALDEVFPRIYHELRSLALAHLGCERGRTPTLQPTALVNEAYLRLSGRSVTPFASRREFYALASRVLRHILVDHLRQGSRHKRGGPAPTVSLDAAGAVAATGGPEPVDVLALHQALERLESSHPGQARIVELRFFGGLTHVEIADVLGLSVATVERRWSVGKRRLATLIADA